MATLAQQWVQEGMLEEARGMVQGAVFSKFRVVPEDILYTRSGDLRTESG